MSYSRIYSGHTQGIGAYIVTLEVDVAQGLHSFTIVGLPDKAVEESKDRVGAALKNSGFTTPKSKNQKVVISLAPADLKKEGALFDLPMALGYLLAINDISFDPEEKLFVGELGLSGELRPIKGILPIALHARKKGIKELFVPYENGQEAGLVDGITIYGAHTLQEVVEHLNNRKKENKKIEPFPKTEVLRNEEEEAWGVTLDDIRGQENAKRALTIAAAGRHNIAFYGPPGTGKTMLARALASLLPPLSREEIFEVTSIHSIAGALVTPIITLPPFRAPHHTSSHVALVGGGGNPRPGEVTLAHRGVLFLDEFPEFEKRSIESLREPLENGMIAVSRAKGTIHFPAQFLLVAAMNPCPCGNFGALDKECICRPLDLIKYERKISGPIVDRIDMWVSVPHISYEMLHEKKGSKNESEDAKEKIKKAHEIMRRRFSTSKKKIYANSDMTTRDIEEYIHLAPDVRNILDQGAKSLSLSPRAYHKVIKLARTIADLDEQEEILQKHILEALQYRPKIKTH